MSGDLPASSLPIGTRVSFPYGGSRRTGVISDVSLMPDPNGGSTVAYLVEVGARKVFVQGDGITPAGEGPAPGDADGGGTVQRRRGGGGRPRRRR